MNQVRIHNKDFCSPCRRKIGRIRRLIFRDYLSAIRSAILVNGQPPYANRIRQAQIMGVVFGQRTQLWWNLQV
jgi:hypothetical protein